MLEERACNISTVLVVCAPPWPERQVRGAGYLGARVEEVFSLGHPPVCFITLYFGCIL